MSTLTLKELSAPTGEVIKIAAGKTLDLNSQGSVIMPTGSVLQVVSTSNSSSISTSSSSYVEISANFRPVITPTLATSSVHYSLALNVNADVDNDANDYVTATIKIDMYIGGVFSSTVYERGNVMNRGGHSRMNHFVFSNIVSPSTTSSVEFRSYFKRDVSPQNRSLHGAVGAAHSGSLMEIQA